MNVKLVFAGRCPSKSVCIEQSRVSRQGIGQHESSVKQNDTLGIADRSRKRPKAPKKRRRGNGSPSIGLRVIYSTLIGPDRDKEVIFATLNDDPAVGKNG